MAEYEQLKEELSEVADIVQEFSSDLQPAVFKLLISEYYNGDLPVSLGQGNDESDLDSESLQADNEKQEASETVIRKKSDGPESFNDFVKGKEYSSHHDRSLLAVYHTTEVLGKEEATDEDIKQRYSDARWRPPKKLRQALNDAKSKKGWVDSTTDENWVPTYEGKNVVKHDMEEDGS